MTMHHIMCLFLSKIETAAEERKSQILSMRASTIRLLALIDRCRKPPVNIDSTFPQLPTLAFLTSLKTSLLSHSSTSSVLSKYNKTLSEWGSFSYDNRDFMQMRLDR